MPISHLSLALFVVLIWGINFIFAKIAVAEISPLLFCTLRFLLASIPAIFFIKPPNISFRIVALYGLFMFALQFGFVFTGLRVGMTAGMASVIMQIQVFFSMLFAAILLGERPTVWQIAGAFISFSGVALVAMHFDKDISFLGFSLVLAAAAAWGIGNLVTKKAHNVNMLALVVWGSFAACFPMMLLFFIFEGPSRAIESYQLLTWQGVIAIIYVVYASTWAGYSIWGWLIHRHPVSTVAPFTLLIPIVSMLASAWMLDEPLQSWKVIAATLVMSGLCVNLLGARLFMKKKSVVI